MGFTFEDPRNIKKEMIINFCRHVKERQDSHGVSEAFQFLRYQNGRDRMSAEYGTRADEDRTAKRALQQKSARKSAALQGRNKKAPAHRKGKERDRGPKNDSGSENQQLTDPNAGEPEGHQNGAHGSGSIYSVFSGHVIPTVEPEQSEPDRVNSQLDIETQRNLPLGQLAIDPALLAEDNRNRARLSKHPRADAGNTDAGHILISSTEMQQLNELGHPPVIPVNGPSDGLPMYLVPTAVRDILDQQRQMEQEQLEQQILVDDARVTINPMAGDEITSKKQKPATQKRGRNADMCTVEEEKALLKKEGRSRSGKKLRCR